MPFYSGKGPITHTPPKPKKVRRPPTVTTVTSSGHVSSTGPGAGKATQAAKQSRRRVRRIVAAQNQRERFGVLRLPTQHVTPINEATGAVGSFIGHQTSDWLSRVQKHGADQVPGLPKHGALGAAVNTMQIATGGESAVGTKTAEKALQQAATSKTIKDVAVDFAKGAKRAPARGAEKAVLKVRRIKSAPSRAVATAKRTPELATKEGQQAAAKATARAAKSHPVRASYSAAAASPVPLPGGADKRARAFAEGTFNAITQHPGETAKTTARSLPGAIAAPAALAAAAGVSILHHSTKPLTNTASMQAKGLGQIASDAFSGDPAKAQKAAQKEGSLAFLTPIPAITRLGRYEKARGGLREAAAAARRKAASTGESANRRVRHAPKGTEEHVFAKAARHEQRKKTALIKQRADNPHNVARAHHEKQITKHIAKAPKGSHVALQTLAEYGIRDAKGAALVRHKGPGDAQLVKALDYVDAHPEVFKSKDFKAALAAVGEASKTAPAALVGKGERARLMQQGDVFGHTRPEHMVPHVARELTAAKTREGAWQELQARDRQLTALRRAGRQKFDQAKVMKGAERQRALSEGKAHYAEARKLQAHNQKLYNALDPYTRPGQSIDASKRTPYNGKMLAEYKAKVEASRKQAGLAPAIYTHHAEANTAGRGTGVENRFPTSAGRVEHMREGNLAKADNLDRSLGGLIRGTVHMPRMRAAGKQFGRDFVKEFKTPFSIDGKQKIVGQGSQDWSAITAPKTKDNPNGGQFDPQSVARFPLREWKNAVKDPFTTEGELMSILHDAENGKIKGSEPWVLMPREAIKEARAQINPEHNILVTGMNKLARVSNRLILGTNPAWAIAQIPAEGIPLLMSKPSLLNPVKLVSLERDIQRYKKTNPEEAMAMQATAGASPVSAAVNRTPLDMQETYTPALWDKGAKALTRGKTARSALSFAKLKALGVVDVKRQNEYRTLLAAAEADKRFRSWHGGLTGLFDSSAKLSRQFRGKSRAELWTWLTKDPKGKVELAKITDYVDNIQGNWTAFTRFERSLAPFTIFYPFLRYSLRWTLWTFPKTHPITATLAYTLGQANANQLEKLVGGKLSNPLAYAYPVYQNEKGQSAVLPGGSRISPGQSSLTQAVANANPAQILSSANPFVGAGITGLTGTEPLSGQQSTLPRGEAAINQLLAMPAPFRLAGLKLGGQSTASKAYAQYDPNKTARSLLFPFIPQSAAKFTASDKLSKAFDAKYSNPVPSLSKEIWDAAYGHDWKAAKKLRAQVAAAKKGGDVVKAAESPFFTDSGGDLGQEGSDILKYITGTIQIPVKAKKKGSAGTPSFGPAAGSTSSSSAPSFGPAAGSSAASRSPSF